ncbi:matrixin family metalloprotease [Chloroflexi bacterium TSY]|nr:matrixin family metalloprotease [Chloroflexi bacterium TSY]
MTPSEPVTPTAVSPTPMPTSTTPTPTDPVSTPTSTPTSAPTLIRFDDFPSIRDLDFFAVTPWDEPTISYFFENGTDDIPGFGEYDAVRAAFEVWDIATKLRFVEVASADVADITISWKSTDAHGDNCDFDSTLLSGKRKEMR